MKNNVIDKNRLENFSDGVIAILITILVMAFKIPDEYQSSNYTIGELIKFLIPQLIPYAISFLVIAVHLINHHILFSKMSAVDSKFIWLNLLFLFSLSLIVYPTELLGQANNQETSAMLLIGAYFFKAISFRILHYYAIFRSGFYKTDKTRKELVRISTINWIKGPAIEIIAFGLIYLDYRYSLILIFITTIYEVIVPKGL